MPECTRTAKRWAHRRALLLVAAGAGALLLLCGSFAAAARADGDPASDVLATQSLFLPQDAHVALAQQTQLEALLGQAGRDGEKIRLAVVASPVDLGSLTTLWAQPQAYASFLGQELSLIYHGLLVVVMPDGYGLFHQGGLSAAQRSALTGARVPARSLGAGTIAAVRRLAASSGHQLALPSASTASTQGSSDVAGWIVFALGAVLITLAWSASVRVRPIRG